MPKSMLRVPLSGLPPMGVDYSLVLVRSGIRYRHFDFSTRLGKSTRLTKEESTSPSSSFSPNQCKQHDSVGTHKRCTPF